MESITLYLIFCITTSICCLYEMIWPAMCGAKQQGIVNPFTQQPLLSSLVFFIINMLFAPLIIFVLFVPRMFEQASSGINKAIREAE